MKFEIFAGPSLEISGGYYKISGGLSFTRAIAQTALLRVVTPRTKKKKVDDPGLKSAHLTETTLHPAFLGQRQHLKVKQGL